MLLSAVTSQETQQYNTRPTTEVQQLWSIYNSKALIIAVIRDINKFNYQTNSQRQCHTKCEGWEDRTFVLDIIFIPTALVCFFLQRCNCCSLYKYLCPALISNKLSVHPDQRGGRPCIGDQSLDKAIRFTIIYRREEDKQLRLCLSPHSKQALKLSMDSGEWAGR